MAKYLNFLFWIIGAVLFIWAVHKVDLSSVKQGLFAIGVGIIPILLAALSVSIMGSIAWKYTFIPRETRNLKFWQLWKIRQVGEAFNLITPLGTLGGEPVKAQLLKRQYSISLKQGIASQVIQRTTTLMALVLFLTCGMILIYQNTLISISFKQISLQALVIFSTLILLFLLFQVTGILNLLASGLRYLPEAKLLNFVCHQLEHLSHNISGYYRRFPKRCMSSIFFAFMGWIIGVIELYVTLYFLGLSLSISEFWIIESLSQLVRSASFFIPLSIGAQETGLVLIFGSMGLSADLGLTVSIVRRIKELVWVAVGLYLGRHILKTKLKWGALESS